AASDSAVLDELLGPGSTVLEFIRSDELVLYLASRTGSYYERRLQVAAAVRVLPVWFAGGLPGKGNADRVADLILGSVEHWPHDLLACVGHHFEQEPPRAGRLHEQAASAVAQELVRRSPAYRERQASEVVTSPLRKLWD